MIVSTAILIGSNGQLAEVFLNLHFVCFLQSGQFLHSAKLLYTRYSRGGAKSAAYWNFNPLISIVVASLLKEKNNR